MGRQSSKKIREMKILFISAHVDDIELACGGAIQKYLSEFHIVKCVTLSHKYGGVDLTEESEDAMRTIGIDNARWCGAETRRFNAHENYIADTCYEQTRGFDVVFTHDIEDRHPDHAIVARQVRRVFNGNLFTFIAPWNGEESAKYHIEITEQQLETKIKALSFA